MDLGPPPAAHAAAPDRLADMGEASGVSLYARVAAALRGRVLQGEWRPGDRIPTLEQLAAGYGVATITVRQAVQLLVADGTLSSARGRGTHVLRNPALPAASAGLRSAINDPRVLGPDHAIRILSREAVAALPPELAHGHAPAPGYVRVRKLHDYRGTSFALMDIYVATAIYRRFPPGADETHKISLLLRDRSGVRIAESREELTIAGADAGTAGLLRCQVAAPLVRVRRWRTDPAGVAIYACIVLYRGDLFVWDHVERTPEADHYGHQVVPTAQLPAGAAAADLAAPRRRRRGG
jgi:DNA-binding GntR family transcriptional regulator